MKTSTTLERRQFLREKLHREGTLSGYDAYEFCLPLTSELAEKDDPSLYLCFGRGWKTIAKGYGVPKKAKITQ